MLYFSGRSLPHITSPIPCIVLSADLPLVGEPSNADHPLGCSVASASSLRVRSPLASICSTRSCRLVSPPPCGAGLGLALVAGLLSLPAGLVVFAVSVNFAGFAREAETTWRL